MNCAAPILLAEDSPQDAEMTLLALRENRLINHVDIVEDGEEALEYLFRTSRYAKRSGPDPMLAVLDLKMPKIDGLEVLRQIRKDEKLRFLPVVILTSSREEQDVAKSYQLGANAYVVKPVKFPEFIEAVKQLGVFWTMHNEPPPQHGFSSGI
jgi:CheY-like chemotaxis protein